MDIEVSNPADFVEDENAKVAVALSLAEKAGVNASDIVVVITLVDLDDETTTRPPKSRRLKNQVVRVTYTIMVTLPPASAVGANSDSTSAQITQMNQLAAALSSAISSVTPIEWGSSITANIQLLYEGDGVASHYAVEVIAVSKPVVAAYVPPEEAAETDTRNGTLVILHSTVITCLIFLTALFSGLMFLLYRRRLRRADRVKAIKIDSCGMTRRKAKKEHDYYLSYAGVHSKMSSQPARLALSIHEELRHRGLRGVMRETDDVPEADIQKMIANSAVLLVCLHDETCLSAICRSEWQYAEDAFLPALCIADLQNCNKQELQKQVIDASQYLLMSRWEDYVLKYRRIVYENVSQFVRHNRTRECVFSMDPVLPGGSVYD